MKKRNTIQRQLIYDAVKRLDIHATAEQVFDYVGQRHPSISKATVYRNLTGLVAAGELLNIGCLDGSFHYDHNCHNHYHLLCKGCQKVFDIEGYFSDICEKVDNTEGFEITGHVLTFSGLCPSCKTMKRQA